jgi:peroxiredoxin
MSSRTIQELDSIRAMARSGTIIPSSSLAVMDQDINALRASGIAGRALKAGQLAPDFILPDAKGEPVRLYSLLKGGQAIVVFYRGGWCPYCTAYLRGFQRALSQLRAKNVQLVAISPQLPDNSLMTRDKGELTFPVLSDVRNKVGHAYGIVFRLSPELLNIYAGFGHPLDKFNGTDGAEELPIPATFLIGQDGKVIQAYVDVDYSYRFNPEDAVAVFEKK